MGLVYRIPSKPWFREHKVDQNTTWKQVYGDKKCAVCGQNYRELEGYTMCPDGKHSRHVTCPPCEYLNDAGGCTINGDCNQRTPEDRLKRQCKVPVVRRKRFTPQQEGVLKALSEIDTNVGSDDFRF